MPALSPACLCRHRKTSAKKRRSCAHVQLRQRRWFPVLGAGVVYSFALNTTTQLLGAPQVTVSPAELDQVLAVV